jgi:hypothetical protein
VTPEKMAFYSGVASGVLSLVFNWTPKLRQKFDTLTSEQQQISMGVMTLIISIAINLYQCIDPDSPTCTDRLSWTNVGVLASTFLAGTVSNQSIDRITPKPKEVRTRRKKRASK